jgi:hypothetical protein
MLQEVGELIGRALNLKKGVGLDRPVGALMDERDFFWIRSVPIADVGRNVVAQGDAPLEGVVDLLIRPSARDRHCRPNLTLGRLSQMF